MVEIRPVSRFVIVVYYLCQLIFRASNNYPAQNDRKTAIAEDFKESRTWPPSSGSVSISTTTIGVD